MQTTEKILILDFGSQYTELIARKIRELNVYSEVHPFDYDISLIEAELNQQTTIHNHKKKNLDSQKLPNTIIKGIILSGGPNSIYAPGAPKCDPQIFKLGIPILGICYGMQLITHDLGGKVSLAKTHEYGHTDLTINAHDCLFKKLPKKIKVWMSHGDKVEKAPPGFKTIANTTSTGFAGIADDKQNIYGVQFHPEVSHTEHGREMLKNFVIDICKCEANWNMQDFIDTSIDEVQKTVGNKSVLLALSGGVDSSTLAFLLYKAVPEQLTCMFIDHGFMRKNEPEELMDIFANKFNMHIKYIDAKKRFWDKLEGVSDPEQKRKIIGNEFIKVFEEEAKKLVKESKNQKHHIEFLAQGTLYPDIIESAGFRIDPQTGEKIAHTIKTHHNVGGLPEKMHFKLLEPLKNLFKDEVRKLARELKVPEEIVKRHPFPGPGLAIRVIGELSQKKLKMAREADLIVREEIVKAGEYDNIWQLLTALLPVKSVGVMGDKRSYAHPVVIRAVTSEDAMTADWARVPHELLAKISSRIVNEVPGVNRVVYDITSKPPGTIEWE